MSETKTFASFHLAGRAPAKYGHEVRQHADNRQHDQLEGPSNSPNDPDDQSDGARHYPKQRAHNGQQLVDDEYCQQ